MKSLLSPTSVALVVGSLCVFMGHASAQDDKPEPPELPKLKEVDANSDSVVTSDELKSYLRENHFDDWSARVELKDLTDGQREKRFVDEYLDAWVQKIDANENRKISKWELRLAFKSLDRVIVEKRDEGDRASKEAENQPPKSAIEMMNLRFESRKPTLGTDVENLVAMDANGEEIDFAELRDKHVVIVFGCLT